jgi:hypothetical protein
MLSTVSGHNKNALGRGSNSNRHITNLEQSTFLDICGPKYTSIDVNRELYRIGPMQELSIDI